MRTLGFVGPLLVAASVFACSSELPTPAEAPEAPQATQQARVSSEQQQESQGASEPRLPSASRAQDQRSERETTEPQDSEQQASPEPESRDSNQAESASAATEANGVEAEPETDSEEPPTELTVIPATVVADAEVRVRPGLPWPVIDRLSAGEEVVVLNVAWGWCRISYGEDLEGWIRTSALDLGEVETHRILDQPAPTIVAEWQGEEYGVMGQSADGAEVRLLDASDELGEIFGAPIDEVRLLADDITVHDLPILIRDETVVFPGDDFGVGQGKILPSADEWMWLPSGWLMAHNETHIWQWHPQADVLRSFYRPPGLAKLSPTGRHVAIYSPHGSVTLVYSFDGLQRAAVAPGRRPMRSHQVSDWSPDGRRLLVERRRERGIEIYHEWVTLSITGTASPLPRVEDAVGDWFWWPMGPLAIWVESGIRFYSTEGIVIGEIALPTGLIRELFISDSGKSALVRSGGGYTLWQAIDVESGDLSVLPFEGLHPSHSGAWWSPDEQLAVIAKLFGGIRSYVYQRTIESVRDLGEEPLGERGISRLWWSPDSAQFLGLMSGPGDGPLVLVDVHSAALLEIELGAGVTIQPCDPQAVWSPDSRRFAVPIQRLGVDGLAIRLATDFNLARPSELVENQFRIYDRAGLFLRELRTVGGTPGSRGVSSARLEWSPDGEWIAVGAMQPHPECLPR